MQFNSKVNERAKRIEWEQNGKTWGDEGTASLLGVKPSTLAYQMKTLGTKKPDA